MLKYDFSTRGSWGHTATSKAYIQALMQRFSGNCENPCLNFRNIKSDNFGPCGKGKGVGDTAL